MNKFKIFLISAILLVAASCDKNFDVDYTYRITGEQAAEKVEQDPSFLSSYVSGFYSYMIQYNTQGSASTQHDDFGFLSITMISDFMGQDIAMNGTQNWGLYDYIHDYGQENYSRPFMLWNFFYTWIGKANEVIDFFQPDEEPSNATLKGYLGQAYAIRAMSYLYLMLYFQNPVDASGALRTDAPAVPIIFASRDSRSLEETEAKGGRNTYADIMEHIEENLALALPLLNGYQRASKNEIDYSVAQGIAARYYLFTQQWAKAADAANKAYQGYSLMNKERLYSGFMDCDDNEVLWGFNHTTETMTAYASFFSMMSNECSGYSGIGQMIKCISSELYGQIPASDYRKGLFNSASGDEGAPLVGGQYPYASRKFGYMAQWLQDYIFMRAAEMMLIEAEAYARLGQQTDAQSVLDVLMAQRDPAYSKTASVEEILLQRRIELWGEGFEYFDLRRTGTGAVRVYEDSNHPQWARIDYPAHAKNWIFQIPLREIQNNMFISEDEQNEL
ncbi:MAG: RagB/SusD family nutrient uptake outer membrane protein [Bacteroidales bacterium]|nr:RagB/SusD family nutrient uptake outer membrane protein [Bacteroidales bacterium]